MFDKFREECGVFGIFGHPEAANLTYLGLYALQHRGQESAGIAASDGTRSACRRRWATSTKRSTRTTLAKLPGSLAVGHVRYSTAGESRLANAQPIVVDSVHGQLALCHNGNLVNASELRDELVREGAIFQTSSDTEVVVHLFARSRAEGAEAAIIDALSQVRGAFSFVMMTKDRLIGVRDPHGFRPLAHRPARRRVGHLLRDVRDGSDRRRPTCATSSPARWSSSAPSTGSSRSSRSRRRRSRSASSSTCTSRAPTATCSARASNEVRTELGRRLARESAVDADVDRADSGLRRVRGDRVTPRRRAFRCGWGSSATTTSAARSSSRSSRSGTSACA